MSGKPFAKLKEDLKAVHDIIKGQLNIKAGYVGNYAHLEFSHIDCFIRPAVVITVARLYNCMSTKVSSLGAIVQFIFMASQVHGLIPETVEDENCDPRDGTQFPVLVGDYLYGKFFTTLCDASIIQYLKPLADIISRINEGGILAKTSKDNATVDQIIRMEVAELFAGSAALTADLVGAPEQEKSFLADFGLNLGMIYGLTQRGVYDNRVMEYSQKAMKALDNLPDYTEKHQLKELINLVMVPESIRKVV